jgi:hypothetical protein
MTGAVYKHIAPTERRQTRLRVVGQFELTPKALANSSPGLLQPWVLECKESKTLKALGPCNANSFRVKKNGDPLTQG